MHGKSHRPAASPRRPPTVLLASTATSAANPSRPHADLRTQLSQFGAGALAGLVNTLILSPLDVVKTRLQAQGGMTGPAGLSSGASTQYTGLLHALRSMLREEGIRSYYRGLSASMWAFVPNWAIYWYTYETCKRLYARPGQRPSALVHVFSALTAGGITAVTTAPFWTLKSRLQVNMSSTATRTRYRSVPHGFRTIIREEGFSGLYKGLTPTLFGLGHVAIQFPLYEYIKSSLATRHHTRALATARAASKPSISPDTIGHNSNLATSATSPSNVAVGTELRAEHVLIASSLSKIAASSVFYPHEVLRTRIQVDTTAVRNSFEIVRVGNLLREILQRDGPRGLYRGFGANLVRTVPACMLTFTSYELAKRFAEKRAADMARNRVMRELAEDQNDS